MQKKSKNILSGGLKIVILHGQTKELSHSVVATREILALLTQVRILMGQRE